MPYICVNTSKTLSEEQKTAVKAGLGAELPIIPGKDESRLMVDISDGHAMYFAGEKRDLAFVDVRCYGKTEFENQKAFTEAVFTLLQQELSLSASDIYLNYTDHATWGAAGSLK